MDPLHSYLFDRFEVLPAERKVRVDGQPATLRARAFDLLLVLIEHRERVLSKDELMALVWPGMVVEELEGLPSALELIAARVGVQTLQQIAAGLDNSLRLLTGGRRGDMQHHQTMRAAVQWSFDLLSPAEQTLFTRLSAFAGGWTLEAAQAVCTGPALAASNGHKLAEEDIPELLARLERSSIMLVHETDGTMRFCMLEPIRQFAYLQLETLGFADATKQQLLVWYTKLCDAIIPQLAGAGQAQG